MKIPDLENIGMLPMGTGLKNICQSLAMIDAILSPEWEYRYFCFNSKWDTGESMASMRDGQGSEYFILFTSLGAVGKVTSKDEDSYDREAIASCLESISDKFPRFVREPAFSPLESSIIFWHDQETTAWHAHPRDHNIPYLKFLTGNVDLIHGWAEFYYERNISKESLAYFVEFNPLRQDKISGLNTEIDVADLKNDIEEIGYPVGI